MSSNSIRDNKIRSKFVALLAFLYAGTFLAVILVICTGFDFYTTPLAERPHHPDYRLFRSAGIVSHGLGIVGTLQILLLLLYSARKRTRLFRQWGALGKWLNLHIYLGISGPVLITLHTTFKVQGLVAVSYWSMMAVACSGVFGRYLYQQLPRNILGQELDANQMKRLKIDLDSKVESAFTAGKEAVLALDRIATGGGDTQAGLQGLLTLPLRNLALRSDLKKFARQFTPVAGARGAIRVAKKSVLLTRRMQVFQSVHALFHYWHVIHKPFAYLMLIIMVIHVLVTVLLGYRWVF